MKIKKSSQAGILALLGLLATFLILQGRESYVISLMAQGQTTISIPLGLEDHFDISFRHSVNKGLVTERYQIDKEAKTIYLKTGWFENYGAGMIDTVEEGMVMTEEGDRLRIDFPRQDTKSVTYRSGGIAGHRLIYENQEIDLFEHWPYESVTISIERKYFSNIFLKDKEA